MRGGTFWIAVENYSDCKAGRDMNLRYEDLRYEDVRERSVLEEFWCEVIEIKTLIDIMGEGRECVRT